MKRLITFFSAFILSLTISAQEYWDGARPDHRFTFGIRVGGNVSKIFDDDGYNGKYRIGFQVGATADINIVRSLSFNTGVFYIQKGYKIEVKGKPGEVVKFDCHPAYIEIPFLLSYRVKLSDAAQFQLNVGPYFSCGIKASDREFFGEANSYDYNLYDYKKNDLGISAGAAITYEHLYAGVNYERSIKSINNSDTKSYNSSIVVSLGYNF